MANNYQQPGNAIDVVAVTEISSGEVAKIGSMIGVAGTDAAIGETFALHLTSVWVLPKVEALAIDTGDVVYYDAESGLVTKTSGGNTKLGVAVESVPNPSPEVAVRLNGAF